MTAAPWPASRPSLRELLTAELDLPVNRGGRYAAELARRTRYTVAQVIAELERMETAGLTRHHAAAGWTNAREARPPRPDLSRASPAPP